MQIDYNARVPMRDGLYLSAIVCRPMGAGPFPSVLTRSCYTKWLAPLAERSRFWTAAGYAFVMQDVRGRGDSDGLFYPLVNEQADTDQENPERKTSKNPREKGVHEEKKQSKAKAGKRNPTRRNTCEDYNSRS